jgi:cytidine deaminase
MSWRQHEPALRAAARAASQSAWAPYSRFHVGAAVLTDDGRVFAGCNVENATYGATVCAERHAVAAAVLAGARRLVACVVYVESDAPAMPCGVCRQVLAEFADDLDVIGFCAADGEVAHRLSELLPHRFAGADIPSMRGEKP